MPICLVQSYTTNIYLNSSDDIFEQKKNSSGNNTMYQNSRPYAFEGKDFNIFVYMYVCLCKTNKPRAWPLFAKGRWLKQCQPSRFRPYTFKIYYITYISLSLWQTVDTSDWAPFLGAWESFEQSLPKSNSQCHFLNISALEFVHNISLLKTLRPSRVGLILSQDIIIYEQLLERSNV